MDAQPIGDGAALQEPMAQDSSESLSGLYSFTLNNLTPQKSFTVVVDCEGRERPVEVKVVRDYLVLDGVWTGQVMEFYAKCADAVDQRIWNELQPVQIRLANPRLEGGYFWRWVRPDLRTARNGWVHLFRLHWKDLVHAENGYVVNDSLKLEIVTK